MGFGAGGICEASMRSTYSLSQETILEVQKKILPSLPEQERAAVEELGKIMRKYANRDLEYIAKTYCW